ncbi:MAG TPA: succinylglutamate desuccinylase/aspartoacylase family protein [Casimicrobiaceae bacterium]|nr:succinylglutamate desuccinylase/aspartoacylase family protein [Casimicrobiaceae bacterium]
MRRTLSVGPFEAASGTVASGLAKIGELADGVTPVQVPVVIINGRDDGPVLYLHAGSHGQETIYSVELLRRLRSEIDPATLEGAIIAVPLANLLAHQVATRVPPHYAAREGVAFAGDIHKLWPGDARGSLTQRIVHFLWTNIVRQTDVAIDLHAVGEPGIPFTFMYRGGKRDAQGTPAWERTLALARAFGVTMVTTAPNPLTLAGACLDDGKPALMIEMTKSRMHDDDTMATALRGIRNVLIELRMLAGAVEPQRDVRVVDGVHPALPTIRAEHGGLIRFEVACGDPVAAGTVIARIRDVFGNELEAIRMPANGYVMTFPPQSWVGNQAVATGDLVADIFA